MNHLGHTDTLTQSNPSKLAWTSWPFLFKPGEESRVNTIANSAIVYVLFHSLRLFWEGILATSADHERMDDSMAMGEETSTVAKENCLLFVPVTRYQI